MYQTAGGYLASHFTTKWCNIILPTIKPYAAKYALMLVYYCIRKLYKTRIVILLCVRQYHKRKISISQSLLHKMCPITSQNKSSNTFKDEAQNPVFKDTKFYILLTVHPVMILGK